MSSSTTSLVRQAETRAGVTTKRTSPRSNVLSLEPYVMNSNEVFARFEAGDYAGTREINGVQHPGLLREYAQGVADGLANTAEVRAARTPLSVAMKSPGTA